MQENNIYCVAFAREEEESIFVYDEDSQAQRLPMHCLMSHVSHIVPFYPWTFLKIEICDTKGSTILLRASCGHISFLRPISVFQILMEWPAGQTSQANHFLLSG